MEFQNSLNNVNQEERPLIILKSKKGYSWPSVDELVFEGNVDVHKNPLSKYEEHKKRYILRKFLEQYNVDLFDENGKILPIFDKFKVNDAESQIERIDTSNIDIDTSLPPSIKKLEDYLYKILQKNNMLVFSPDEIYSNHLGKLNSKTFELLNENVLQALFQGFSQSGKRGIFIGYESFMPIVSSMITQYYKYLLQLQKEKNYITSINLYFNFYLLGKYIFTPKSGFCQHIIREI